LADGAESLTRACGKVGGRCVVGVEHCDDSGAWVGCTAVGPFPETCNGLDDDCDGTLDGSEGLTRTCGSSNFGSCTLGEERCNDHGEWVECNAVFPTTEVCNYIDDNCNNTPDDGFDLFTDPAHCGACGRACSATERCCGGVCLPQGLVATANLLGNPGAEAGNQAWAVSDPNLEILGSGECSSVSPHSGSYFFAVGGVCDSGGDHGEAFQRIDITAFAVAVDNARATAHYAGYLCDKSGNDLPEIFLVFRDAATNELDRTDRLRGDYSSWTLLQDAAAVPVSTRFIDFVMSGTKIAGNNNDSYVDDVELTLQFCAG
jgi:hypothetical protein